jgi:hypothetical protein
VEPSPENAGRIWDALLEFGAPVAALGVVRDDLSRPDTVVQIGLPPRRIDILTGISGVEFETAWHGRVSHAVSGVEVPFIGRRELISNKRATGRAKDLADLEALGAHDQ